MLGVLLAPLRLLPEATHALVLSHLTNHLLRGQVVTKRLLELDGKVISLGVEDLAIELRFRIHDGQLLTARQASPNVVIRGTSEAFLSLALRREDPDTLFFQRRLSVEGETETGVHIKNLIDSFDYDLQGHLNAVLPPEPARLLGRLSMAVWHRRHVLPIPGRPRQ